MFNSIGKIIYSPSTHLANSKKWAIVACDNNIGDYYLNLFNKQNIPRNNTEYAKLHKPVWQSHISWIRNEKVSKNWKLDNNKIIEFEYESGIKNNDTFYWLNVKCEYLEDLRVKLGLSKLPKYGFHLTIGRKTL